jgi:hypothetical protein
MRAVGPQAIGPNVCRWPSADGGLGVRIISVQDQIRKQSQAPIGGN